MKTEAETGWTGHARSHQKLEEARKDLSLEPAEGAPGCWHPGFALLASQNAWSTCPAGLWYFATGAHRTLTHLGPDCHHKRLVSRLSAP